MARTEWFSRAKATGFVCHTIRCVRASVPWSRTTRWICATRCITSVMSSTSPVQLSDPPGSVHLAPSRHETGDGLVELYRGESNIPFILDTAGMRHLYFNLAAVQS